MADKDSLGGLMAGEKNPIDKALDGMKVRTESFGVVPGMGNGILSQDTAATLVGPAAAATATAAIGATVRAFTDKALLTSMAVPVVTANPGLLINAAMQAGLNIEIPSTPTVKPAGGAGGPARK